MPDEGDPWEPGPQEVHRQHGPTGDAGGAGAGVRLRNLEHQGGRGHTPPAFLRQFPSKLQVSYLKSCKL